MQGSVAVGFYDGAYKFIEASMFIPVSIVNVLLPVMARSFITDKSSYGNVYIHSTRVLAMSILPVVIFVSFFAKEIILLVYGEVYLPSAPALSLLIWALFFIFLNAPVSNIIATSKLMHAFLPYAIGNTLLNIFLNFVLIPKYSFLGASFTTVFTEFTGFAIQLWFVNRVLRNSSHILWITGKLIAAGMATSVLFYVIKSVLMFPFNIILLLGIYSTSVFVFRVVGRDDKQLCVELISSIKAKFPFKFGKV
jgi:O-antigen/teichoic acid export membrane protein